jgi:hypothetical protein
VTERLGEVPEKLPGFGVDLLGEQADVIRVACGSLEHVTGPVDATRQRKCVSEPERAKEEGSLAALEAVDTGLGSVPIDQAVLVREPFLDCLDRGEHTGSVAGRSPTMGNIRLEASSASVPTWPAASSSSRPITEGRRSAGT